VDSLLWTVPEFVRRFAAMLPGLLIPVLAFGAAPAHHWASYPVDATFKHMTMAQNLSQSTVYCTLQDSRGFLWFGTEYGLNLYDGNKFTTFYHTSGREDTIGSDWANCLLEDPRGYLWVGTEEGGLSRIDLHTMTVHSTLKDHGPVPTGSVSCLALDREGNLWVGTRRGLFMLPASCMPPAQQRFLFFPYKPDDPHGLPTKWVMSLLVDSHGTIWLGGALRGGFCRVSKNGESYVFERIYQGSSKSNRPPFSAVFSIAEDDLGVIWLGAYDGLYSYLPGKGTMHRYVPKPGDKYSLNSRLFTRLYMDRQRNLWVATDKEGLGRMMPRTGSEEHPRFEVYRHQPMDPNSLGGDSVRSIYQDRSGVLWLGIYQMGLSKLILGQEAAGGNSVAQYCNKPFDPGSLSGDLIAAMIEDREGNLWIGTDGKGLNRAIPPRNPGEPLRFERFRADPSRKGALQDDAVLALCQDHKNRIWAGTFLGGLVRIDFPSGSTSGAPRFVHYMPRQGDPTSLSGPYVTAIYEDRKQRLWALTVGGLNLFDPSTGKFKTYRPGPETGLSTSSLHSIAEDRYGTLWLGSELGVNRFNPETGKAKAYLPGNAPGSLSHPVAYAVHVDSKGTLWVGTNGGGLARADVPPWDGPDPRFIAYRSEDGLPDNVIKSIVEDAKGRLWLSTIRALCRFDPSEGKGHTFPWRPELLNNEFIRNSSQLLKTGELAFGGIHGFCILNPDDIVSDTQPPVVTITDLKLSGKTVQAGIPINGRVLLDRAMPETREITLTDKEYEFSLEFAALHFRSPDKNQFAYMMEGLDQSWNFPGNRNFVTYTTLPPGEYRFRVKAANCDGLWNDTGTSLKIHILPPWWMRRWVHLIVIGLLAGLIYAGVRLRLRALRNRNRMLKATVAARTRDLAEANENLEQTVHLRTLELQQANERLREEVVVRQKSEEQLMQSQKLESVGRLAGGVAHDFNNLLTVINGYSDLMMQDEQLGIDGLKANAKEIRIAGERAAELTKQLLAFSRKQVLQPEVVDLNKLVLDMQKMLSRLLPEDIRLQVKTDPDPCRILVDPGQMGQILMNLAVNARDAMPGGGQLMIETDLVELGPESLGDRPYVEPGSYVRLAVMDTGAGMDEDTQARIFEPFFTTKEPGKGTGLGLSTVFGIVKQSGGYIWVYSEVGKGAAFKIYLPRVEGTLGQSWGVEAEAEVVCGGETILVAEDQDAVRSLVVRTLTSKGYKVLKAADGEEALTIAEGFEGHIDLLFTDIVMPGLNGQDLARRILEKRPETRVILTSGYAESLATETGVLDAGMTLLQKPFSPHRLILSIQKALKDT
jgi:signal transduction histidine kinase/ligand-binding sensor domain-containing protein/ActR/RegA family two-component response regulator